jgi:hypothetical protein
MPFGRLSAYADPALTQTWVYCCNELQCGHLVKLCIQAAIDAYGIRQWMSFGAGCGAQSAAEARMIRDSNDADCLPPS